MLHPFSRRLSAKINVSLQCRLTGLVLASHLRRRIRAADLLDALLTNDMGIIHKCCLYQALLRIGQCPMNFSPPRSLWCLEVVDEHKLKFGYLGQVVQGTLCT